MKRARTNIVFINHSVRDGGPGKSLLYILKYLDREKLNPFVIIPKEDVFSERLKECGIYENIVVDSRFPENLFRPVLLPSNLFKPLVKRFSLFRKLVRFLYGTMNIILLGLFIKDFGSFLRRNDIEVIYCNGTIAKIVGALIGYMNGTDVIWHVRNIQHTWVLRYLIRKLSRFSAVKKIICVSNATADQFEDEVKQKILVVYNGLDPNEFDPEKTEGTLRKQYNIDKDTVVIGSTGRIVPRKGYEEFIRNVPLLFQRLGKENKIKFVIVGDTPHFFHMDYIDHLKSVVKELGLENYFIFTGYRDDINSFLVDMDIFFIPSNYPDPFPRSVIEAMSYGLPVVGFRIGGIAEAFEEGVSGFYSLPGDYENMINNLARLVEDKELRIKMGNEARKKVICSYDARVLTKKIEDVILDVSSKR